MHHVRHSLCWAIPLLGAGVFAACLGRLPDLSNTGQQPSVQVVTTAPTDTPVLEPPTIDLKVLTLTANLTAPPLPPPTFYTPNPLNAEGTPKTATPLPATLAPGQTPATMPPPPRHPGKAVDLSQGTPEPQIIISVRRANGDYDTYRIPTRLFENFTGEAQNQRFNQLMEIEPGDEILGWQWPSNNGPASPISTTVTANPDLTARQVIMSTYIDYAADVLGVVVDGNMKVLHVEVDSAAAKAGIQEGDVLDTLDDLAFMKDRQKVKDKIHEPNFSEPKKVKKFKLKFKRADKMQDVEVSPGPPTAQPVQGTVTPVWDPEDYF